MTHQCAATQPNCSLCSDAGGLECAECKLGYFLQEKTCFECSRAISGCALCSSARTCLQPCPAGCSACVGKICSSCENGRYLTAGTCVPCGAGSDCGCGGVRAGFCEQCTADGQLCAKCVSGYESVRGECIQVSFALSLYGGIAMVAVFAVAALLTFICLVRQCLGQRAGELALTRLAGGPRNAVLMPGKFL